MIGPAAQYTVQAQHGLKLRMLLNSVHPNRLLLGVEWIVGHNSNAHASEAKCLTNVRVDALRTKERACLLQVRAICRQVESVENSDDSAGGFRDRTIFNEQRLPDSVGLFEFRKIPILLRAHRRRAKKLGLEIMVGEELIDSPEAKAAEGRRKKMRVDINEVGCRKDLTYRSFDLIVCKRRVLRSRGFHRHSCV